METPTREGQPHLHAEATDFGFGPAHALITLLEPMQARSALTIWSSGNAADLLRQSVPNAVIRTCSARPSDWPEVLAEIPPESPVLTMSVPFGEAAKRHGAWVVVVDQLHWMWDWTGTSGPAVDLYLAPDYFGSPQVPPGAQRVAPLVGPAFRLQSGTPRPAVGSAVVAFGGMSVMGERLANDQYAGWLLSVLLPALAHSPGVTSIQIVGGSPSLSQLVVAQDAGDKQVVVHGVLPPNLYSELLRGSAHQFLSPGLAAIYEAEGLGISPFFLPTTTKSGLMQAADVLTLPYPHVGTWRWQHDLLPQLVRLPQATALTRIAQAVDRSMLDKDSSWVEAAVTYLAGPRSPLVLPRRPAPAAEDVVLEALALRGL